jgi:hypothetical protein
MARYRTTVHSRYDVDQAFAYLADFSRCVEWDPGVVEARRLTEEPIGLGTRFGLVASFLGRRVPLDYEVTAYEPDRRVTLTAENGLIQSVDEITFTATADGSDVTYDAQLRGRGAFRVVDPLLGLAFGRIGDRARDGLIRELNR